MCRLEITWFSEKNEEIIKDIMLVIIKKCDAVSHLLRDRAFMIGLKIIKIIIQVNASSRRLTRT